MPPKKRVVANNLKINIGISKKCGRECNHHTLARFTDNITDHFALKFLEPHATTASHT